MLHSWTHRLRPVLIGVVVLVISASAAFAAQPSGVPDGRSVGSDKSGKSVPTATTGPAQDEQGAEDPEPTETPEANDPQGDGSDNCTTDPRTLTEEQIAAMPHGQVVCGAANMETPDGYANHGAWVSEWAKKNKGGPNANGHATGPSTQK